MDFDYIVKVTAHNEVAGETNDIDFESSAAFAQDDQGYSLLYYDPTGETPIKTFIRYRNNKRLTIKNHGDMETFIPIECGKRHSSSHILPFGRFYLGVTGLEISSNVNESCGCLHIKYETDTDGEHLGLMDFYISFHKKGTEQTLHF